MRMWLSWVSSITTPYNRNVHNDMGNDGFDLELTEVEDEYASLRITRTQTGWQFLSPSQKKFALVSWSATGDPADAVLLARGRVSEMPGNLFSYRQEIVLTCAPRDIDRKILEYAKARLDTEPEVDKLFSDWDPENPQAYLAGRSAVYHVDPVTHAIRLIDDLEGDRIVDLRRLGYSEGTGPSDGPGTDGPLVKTVRGKITVAWTQAESGSVDIAGAIGSISTLDPNFGSNLQGMLQFESAEGWSMSPDGYQVSVTSGPTPEYDPGTVYEVSDYPPADDLGVYPEPDVSEHTIQASLVEYVVKVKSLQMQYEFSQDREETLYAALDLPIAETGIEADSDDVVEMSLSDIFESEIPDYEIGVAYEEGQIVRFDGRYYRAVRPHVATDFYQTVGIKTQVDGSGGFARQTYVTQVGMWASATAGGIEVGGMSPRTPGFFEGARGRRCIQHLMMRLRKEGRRRLRARRIRLRYPWLDAVHVRRSDSVRIDVPWGDGMRDVVGKVLSLKKVWPERKAPYVEIEIGVSFGSGGASLSSDAYGEDDYGEPGYSVVSTSHGDVTYQIESEPVKNYDGAGINGVGAGSLVTVRKGGNSGAQIAAAMAIAARGGDFRQCSVECPTWVAARMRPIVNSGTLKREIDVVGVLARGFSGVSL